MVLDSLYLNSRVFNIFLALNIIYGVSVDFETINIICCSDGVTLVM